jgi:hypothetical protein
MRRDTIAAFALMLVLLLVQAWLWFAFLPNSAGKVSVDFSLWLPDMLAGYYWYLRNGMFVMPWFSPSQCAGIPFHADPQGFFLSLPQFLAFVMSPLAAVRWTFVAFAAAGFWGAWHLARRTFALSTAMSLLAAALFMLNEFFAVRMVVGHITYAPFMLAPAFAAAMLRPPELASATRAESLLRVLIGGFCLAVAIQAGMVHIIPPMYLSLIAVALIHALRFAPQPDALLRLALATLAGMALCAGKLAAGLALLTTLPRDLYPLPGIAGLPATLYVGLRALFTPVSGRLGDMIVHSHLIMEQHEFAYGVGPVPAMLMLAAAAVALTLWRRRAHRRPLCPDAQLGTLLAAPRRALTLALFLAVTLSVPIALNIYVPRWNALLKSLPYFGSSSNLLRWFSAWILPAILGGALAGERLAARWPRLAAPVAAGGIVLTLIVSGTSDHTRYGPPPAGIGFYDARDIDAAWQRAHDSGAPPPVTAITKLVDADHHLLMAPERQNAMTQGYSMLFCYAPLFGYRLEQFPFGNIRLGNAFLDHNGVLNFKNPACYVFPAANHCTPGDQFTEAQADALRIFLAYGPLPFNKPVNAELADWIGILSLLVYPLLLAWSIWQLRRPAPDKHATTEGGGAL